VLKRTIREIRQEEFCETQAKVIRVIVRVAARRQTWI
jgi:hypothetical protein